MLIIGAKGFAKEILEIFHQEGKLDGLAFYDDVNADVFGLLYDRFPIIKTAELARDHFRTSGNSFTIGIGNPLLRYKLYNKFVEMGGEYTSCISSSAIIGSYDVTIGEGSNVLASAVFSNSTRLGKGCIVYYNVVITHDCQIGDFVELSPNVQVLGRCTIGDFTSIGANSTILPDIKIGSNVVIGAGSVVTRDIPSDCVVVGTPARIIKKREPLQF